MPLIDRGRRAPSFSLRDQHGCPNSLKDHAGRPVVLYFYPADNTETCTKQACAFRDALPRFESARAAVIGVSPDSPESHAGFAAAHHLPFVLLADPPGPDGVPKVCDKFGVWQEKSMYGRKYMGVVRTTYLIGPDGRVVRRWDRVRVPGHAEKVLDALREL